MLLKLKKYYIIIKVLKYGGILKTIKFKNGNLNILNDFFTSYEEKINDIFIKIASDLEYYVNYS